MTTRNFEQVRSVLPLILDEAEIFAFKFWFNDSICDGMYYKNELFCRLETFDLLNRSHVYQLGCKLSRQNVSVILTLTSATCDLWGSLRAPIVKDILLNPTMLKLSDPELHHATGTLSIQPQANDPSAESLPS